jgi:hypothetical protein
MWRNVAVAALLAPLGVAVGALLRNQIATVIGLFVVGLGVEPALFSAAPDVARFGPLLGAPNGILGVDHGALLAPGLAAIVCIAWAASAFVSAAALLHRRDLV